YYFRIVPRHHCHRNHCDSAKLCLQPSAGRLYQNRSLDVSTCPFPLFLRDTFSRPPNTLSAFDDHPFTTYIICPIDASRLRNANPSGPSIHSNGDVSSAFHLERIRTLRLDSME